LSSGGGGASPSACDFEPKIWLNRLPIDGLLAAAAESPLGLEPPNMLPPPQPASVTLNRAATSKGARLRTNPP
jgi:hypothetical protein